MDVLRKADQDLLRHLIGVVVGKAAPANQAEDELPVASGELGPGVGVIAVAQTPWEGGGGESAVTAR